MVLYKCPWCTFVTTSLGGYKKHLLSHIVIGKNNVCPVCGREFDSYRALWDHICHVKYNDCDHLLLYFILSSYVSRNRYSKKVKQMLRECYAIK